LIDYAGKLARDKNSSLTQKFVNLGRKKFYNIGPWISVANVDPAFDFKATSLADPEDSLRPELAAVSRPAAVLELLF
jgi:hypothetical protein